MRGRVTPRDVGRGAAAAVAMLAAMAAVAAAGLLLLDAVRFGELTVLTAAVVVLAAGGSVDVEAAPSGLPVNLEGVIEVMPLGVSLVGTLVLGAMLVRGGMAGLLVRSGTATAVLLAGIAAVALSAHGTLTMHLPQIESMADNGSDERSDLGGALNALDIGFSVATGPTLVAAACWTIFVVAVCWVVLRVRPVARAARAVMLSIGAGIVLVTAGTWVLWGPTAAGTLLLGWPLAVSGALLIGFGVPLPVHADGMLASLLDGAEFVDNAESALHSWPLAPGGPLTWVALALLLSIGVLAARAIPVTGGPMRRAFVTAAILAPVVGIVLTILTLITRISVDISVTVLGPTQPVLDAGLDAEPWLAAGVGLAAGAVAGFAGSLFVLGTRKITSVG